MVSDLSDEEVEVSTGVKVPAKNIEYIKKKNELRALERHVINIIFNLGGEAAEDSEETKILLRRRSLRMLMEAKAAKTRTDPRWSEYKRVALRRTEAKCAESRRAEAKCTESRRTGPRRAENKCSKLRLVRKSQNKSTQQQHVESVTVEEVKHQWTEYQQVEKTTQCTQFQQAEQQWVDCVLLDSPETTPILLAPAESTQPQYTQVQQVTEVVVVKKIRIYEEIIKVK